MYELTFYVHPDRFVRAMQYPLYRRSISREGERAANKAQLAQIESIGRDMLEEAIANLKMHDYFLINGFNEDDLRDAQISMSFANVCPMPQGRMIARDQFFTIIHKPDGEPLAWATTTMFPGQSDDITYIHNDKRHR